MSCTIRFRYLLAALVVTSFMHVGIATAEPSLAFHNMTESDRPYPVGQKDPTLIAGVVLDVPDRSLVLVQFTSTASSGDGKTCPCSLRAFLRADDGELQAVKRINIGAPAVSEVLKYIADRQSLDGALVFVADKGTHKYELLVEQVTGSNKTINIWYPNIQAIAFLQK
jgi:hypothetical protein